MTHSRAGSKKKRVRKPNRISLRKVGIEIDCFEDGIGIEITKTSPTGAFAFIHPDHAPRLIKWLGDFVAWVDEREI